jgi:primosomal replication protein N
VSSNRLEIEGEVVALDLLRYTPAGIPLVNITFRHTSIQNEAGMKRQAECEIQAVAMDELAKKAVKLSIGEQIKVVGFLARKSLKNDRLMLHINELEIIS